MLKQLINELRRNAFFGLLHFLIVAITIAVVMLFAMKLENDLGAKTPEEQLDRTMAVWRMKFIKANDKGIQQSSLSLRFCNNHLLTMKTPKLTTIFTEARWAFLQQNETKKYAAKYVDAAFFELHNFHFLEGEGITPQQFVNQEAVIVLSKSVRDAFFSEQSVLGKLFSYNEKTYTIVGVVDDVPTSCINAFAHLWTIRPVQAKAESREFCGDYTCLLLAKTKSDIALIEAEVAEVIKRQNRNFTKGEKIQISGPATHFDRFFISYGDPEDYIGKTAQWAVIIGQFFGLLLVPIISLVSLQEIYIRERSEEIAVRKSFGAKRIDIIRQLVAENIVLTLIGGAFGLLLSVVLAYTFPEFVFVTDSFDKVASYHLVLNYKIFVIAFVIMLFFGSVVGVFPARRISKLEPARVLKGGEL